MMQLKEISGLIYPWPKMFESLSNMILDFDRYGFVKKNILAKGFIEFLLVILTFGVVVPILIPLVLLGYSFERFIISPMVDIIDNLFNKDKLSAALGIVLAIMIVPLLLTYYLPDIIRRAISKKKSKTTPIRDVYYSTFHPDFSDDPKVLNSKPLGPRYSDITHKIDMTK